MDNYSSLVDLLIKDEMSGNPRHEGVLFLGDTPSFLIEKAGFPKLKLAIQASVISKACFEHGTSTSLLKRLPEVIASPKCIFKSANPALTDSVVVLTFELRECTR